MKFILCRFPCWNWMINDKYEGYICNMQLSADREVSKSNKKFRLNFWYFFDLKISSDNIELVFQICFNKVQNIVLFLSEYNWGKFRNFSSNDNFFVFDDLFDDIFSVVLFVFDLFILFFFCFNSSSFCFNSPLFNSSFMLSISFWYSGFNLNIYSVLFSSLSSFFSFSSFSSLSLSFSLSFSFSFSSFFSFSFSFSSSFFSSFFSSDFSFSTMKNNFLIVFTKISLLSILI